MQESPVISVLSVVSFLYEGVEVTGKVRAIFIAPNNAGVSSTWLEVNFEYPHMPSTTRTTRINARIDNLRKIQLKVIR